MEHGPISFPDWKQALARAGFALVLSGRKTEGGGQTTAAGFLSARREERRRGRAHPRPGVEARRDAGVPAPVSRRPMEPPPAASDLGTAPWERNLIWAIRERHFLWRREQTCREWAVRFARFIAPRSPYAAGGDEVAAFLSGMAVQGRAGPSAQKQALNALVFLMLEALHRDLGQLEFTRPAARRRVPTVLHPHRPGTHGPRQRRDHPDLPARDEKARTGRAVAAGPMKKARLGAAP